MDIPSAYVLALAGLRPNPAVGDLTVAFSLAAPAPATLQVLDVAGRVLASREVGALGPGHHVVEMGSARRVPPGVYFVRLSQGEHTFSTRGCVVR